VPGVNQAARWQQIPSTVPFDIHAWRARRIPWGSIDPSSDYTRDVRQDLADGLLANGAGAITGITYTLDLKAISAIGSSYYPLIS
jgi:hypothetical protein